MKSRYLLPTLALGLGLTAVLLLLLTYPIPVVCADPAVYVYYVRAGGTGTTCTPTDPCGSVQQAINLASDGDEVWVATGTYTENLDIVHGLSLRGGWQTDFAVQHPLTTPATIHGPGDHAENLVAINAGTAPVTIEGFMLRNGEDGLNIDSGAVTVTHVTLADIKKQAVDVDGGTIVVQQSVITDIQREAVQVEDGNVLVRDCILVNVGQDTSKTRAGIRVEGGNVHVEHTSITDATFEGVHIVDGTVVLEDVTIVGAGHEGVQVEAGTTSILSCTIHATVQEGIKISGTHTVSGNLVYDTGEDGIYAHDGTATVVNNTVHDIGGDGIRTADGATVSIYGNTIYSASDDCIEASGDTVLVANNFISGCKDHGIKAQGANHTFINANQVYDANQDHNADTAGIDLDDAGTFTVTNNIVADSSWASVFIETAAGPHNFLYHNTLVGSATGQQGTGISVTVPGITIALVNNIVVSHSAGIAVTPGATLIVSNTLLWGNGDAPISGTLLLPPMFVAPAQQDYHLLPNSPAVDAGIDVGVTRDVDGDHRPIGVLPDIGADEVRLRTFLPLVLRDY